MLRPVEAADVARLAAILAEPAVARWWGGYDAARVVADLVEDEDATHWAVEMDGEGGGREVVGHVQAFEELEPEYLHASIDLFLATAVHGRGVGPEVVHAVARWLIEARGHHRLTIDPAAANAAAIRAYGKVGFRPVGIMRRYERGPDGAWHDGLLMDLVAEELRDPRSPA